MKLRMRERNILKEYISFPQAQEHLYTAGRRRGGSHTKKRYLDQENKILKALSEAED